MRLTWALLFAAGLLTAVIIASWFWR